MKNIVATVFFALVLNSAPDQDSCQFYIDLEEQWQCNHTPYRYLAQYGLKYCQHFLLMRASADEQLKRFLENTALCLQNMLQQYALSSDKDKAPSCKQLEQFAFKSHTPCYDQNGFQTLGISNQAEVARSLINIDLLMKPRYSITQALKIGAICLEEKLQNRRCHLL